MECPCPGEGELTRAEVLDRLGVKDFARIASASQYKAGTKSVDATMKACYFFYLLENWPRDSYVGPSDVRRFRNEIRVEESFWAEMLRAWRTRRRNQ